MIVIGIDPGTVTGFAIWDPHTRQLLAVESHKLHQALSRVEALKPDNPLVIFEDARTMRLGGGATFGQKSRLQGVGSVKRDSAIWEEFLEDLGVPYQAKKWCAGTTKWDAARFAQTTGWTLQTNNHGRDAGVIVYGLNLPMAEGIVRSWEQRSGNATRPSSAKVSRNAGTHARRSSTPAGV